MRHNYMVTMKLPLPFYTKLKKWFLLSEGSSVIIVRSQQWQRGLGGNRLWPCFGPLCRPFFWSLLGPFFALLNKERNYSSKNDPKSSAKLYVPVSFSNGTLGRFSGQKFLNTLNGLYGSASETLRFGRRRGACGVSKELLIDERLREVAVFSTAALLTYHSTSPLTTYVHFHSHSFIYCTFLCNNTNKIDQCEMMISQQI